MTPEKFQAEIAIITRTKDRPLLLPRAIESVLAQTCTGWIHVIVNDGGDAGTLNAIATAYHDRYAGRLILHHHPASKGMEASSNAGLALCNSRYVVVLDDDDSWHPEFLDRCLAVLKSPPLPNIRGVVCHSMRIEERIDADGHIHEIKRSLFNAWLKAVDIPRLCASNTFTNNAFLFERSIIDEIGPFDENLQMMGDWDFNLRVALAGEILVIPEALAFYHLRHADASAYGNTVTMQLDQHRRCRGYLINKWARKEYAEGHFSVAQAMAVSELNRESYKFSLRANKFFDIFKKAS